MNRRNFIKNTAKATVATVAALTIPAVLVHNDDEINLWDKCWDKLLDSSGGILSLMKEQQTAVAYSGEITIKEAAELFHQQLKLYDYKPFFIRPV